MTQKNREFQVFVKPVGALCNLQCDYCYYLETEKSEQKENSFIMPDDLLEKYITQNIRASMGQVINFSWHGGEPTMAGIDFYKRVVDIQKIHKPANRTIVNGIQTNGILLDERWCRFLAGEKFIVGLSMDGPREFHDIYRRNKDHKPTFNKVLEAFRLMQDCGTVPEILCVVHAGNVDNPLEVYRFFRQLGARHMTFLPLVIRQPGSDKGVTADSVPSEGFGDFVTAIFDEWVKNDIGKIKVQLFEEAARTAFRQDHTLCIFRKTCGGVPVVEKNGDFYSCDHFVDQKHLVGNINETDLKDLLDSRQQHDFGQAKLTTLPQYCVDCEVRPMCNGECPKNRFIRTPDGEPGLNYLCAGYRKFFNHCRPWVSAVTAAWNLKNRGGSASAFPDQTIQNKRNQPVPGKINRNDPCPCGSGKKYKKCCLGS